MNEITQTTQGYTDPTFGKDIADLVEVMDAQGNPTGEFRPRTPTPTEETIFTTAEDGEHVVN